jgi:hypothetical protein
MTPQTQTLLNEIKALGVELTINGKDLRLAGPKGAITEAYKTRLLRAKPEIVAALKPPLIRVYQVTTNGQAFTMICPRHYDLALAQKSIDNQFANSSNNTVIEHR